MALGSQTWLAVETPGREDLGASSRKMWSRLDMEAPYLPQLGVVSCGRARGAPKPGQPLLTFAVWIRSSPRRRTRGSGYPAGRKRGKRDAPESQTGQGPGLQTELGTHLLRQATPIAGAGGGSIPKDASHTPRTKPHPRAQHLEVPRS